MEKQRLLGEEMVSSGLAMLSLSWGVALELPLANTPFPLTRPACKVTPGPGLLLKVSSGITGWGGGLGASEDRRLQL